MQRKPLSLYEFNLLIKEVISYSLPDTFLITAEIASLNVDVKGHCYMALVEKDENTIKAQMDARIWASSYKLILKDFETATGVTLSKGLKILIEASINFHERYGLSLTIKNIDPTYTLGEMARRRREIIERLTKEGLIDKNRAIPMPLVPQRIAIISSKNAAGYEDFVKHINLNTYGYVFYIKLFEAIMQGDRAEASILSALDAIEGKREEFDLVVIVRGGGATTDLDCFDSYNIGKKIALLSLPVMAGIGHERDYTVVDEVSHVRVKTPTAGASYIIEIVKGFEDRLNTISVNLLNATRRLNESLLRNLVALTTALFSAANTTVTKNAYVLDGYRKPILYARRLLLSKLADLKNLLYRLSSSSNVHIASNEGYLNETVRRLIREPAQLLRKQEERLQLMMEKLTFMEPKNMLKMGYTITYHKGKAVKSVEDIEVHGKVTTVFKDGSIDSEVLAVQKEVLKQYG
ncbi:MAG: exodeoxyribonuclease VII large subunit [Candidatus Magnetoovum sp. WYHC-5]|nr:exodeoxyribonuclease VII large subunit [Candidatus Magnetoovum sp. WYHC-5]